MAPEETGTDMTTPAVEVHDLTKDYGPRRVLDVEHFAVTPGTICAVVGPNGSGKTALLSLLALLESPTSGTIALFGEEAKRAPGARRHLRRRVVMVHEQPWMFHTTVLDNVTYGLSARGVRRGDARRLATAALESVGMAHAGEWSARGLSAGEARRVALARALAVGPDLILLDEPLADIDARNATVVENVIRDLPSRGTTVLLATHRLEVAYRLADQCLSLGDGRIRQALPDNHFAGTITEDEGEPVMKIAPGRVLRLSTEVRGAAHVIIDPRTVVLSRAPAPSSARNHFSGPITGLQTERDRVRVTVDVGVPIVALITQRSFRQMELHLGEEISVVFKTVSLDVYGGKVE